MIHCLLIKVSHNSRGLPVRSYHTLTCDELTLGRGAENKVHLSDPRVAMHHAVIKRLDDGQPHLVAIHGELEVDGAQQQSVALTHGQRVMIGPYQLTVEPAPPDVDLAVSLVLAHRLPDDYQDLKSRTREPLSGAAAFKRRLALWLAGLTALVFLGLPLAQVLISSFRTTMNEQPMGFDRVWSPGRISTAHQHFGAQCANCHQVPGQRVTDQACLACHRDTAPHIVDPALQQHAFAAKGRYFLHGGVRCIECHSEHKAPYPLVRQYNGVCVRCHGDIKAVNPKSLLPDIHDFDHDHPGFKLSFKTGPGEQDVERIAQADKTHLKENSGLKFPHSQHIGLVQGPGGMSDIRQLTCASCHHPEGKEMRFAVVSFKRDCLSCHADRLEVGPANATLRLPHGAEQDVINVLKAGAPKQFARYSETLKSDGCGYCHDMVSPAKDDPLPWRVTPLHITQDWFSKARFNHASHRTQRCQSCHAVEHSESSADVAIPDKLSCLRCHAGSSPKYRRIASSCMSCHDFHNPHVSSYGGGGANAQDVAPQPR